MISETLALVSASAENFFKRVRALVFGGARQACSSGTMSRVRQQHKTKKTQKYISISVVKIPSGLKRRAPVGATSRQTTHMRTQSTLRSSAHTHQHRARDV